MASHDPKAIGKEIAKARRAKGWTQLDLAFAAKEAGLVTSPSTIQRWEAGRLPRIMKLVRLAELLEVEAERFGFHSSTDGRPASQLLQELTGAVAELADTEKEILERVRDIQDRVGRLEGRRPKSAGGRG